MRWLGCPQTCLVGVELQRNGQPIFCRPKVDQPGGVRCLRRGGQAQAIATGPVPSSQWDGQTLTARRRPIRRQALIVV
jgi:hypothetical protein